MFISINRIGDSITGSYGATTFGVTFTEEKWKAMSELEEASRNASTPDELNAIYEEFAKLTEESFKETIETEYPDLHVNAATGKFYLKVGDKVSSVAMPEGLVERIKDTVDKGLDATPVIKFWTRWLRNPILRRKDNEGRDDFSSRMVAYVNALFVDGDTMADLLENKGVTPEIAKERASVYQVKITNEGLLCTYKVSTEITKRHAFDEHGNPIQVDRYEKTIDPDTGIVSYNEPEHVEERLFEPAVQGRHGDAFYCEGVNGFKEPDHFIRVGCTHRLPDWSYVNTNNHTSCVKGLHVGGLSYISGYQNSTDAVTHNVFVDPMHVGAIPNCHTDGDGAIRCLQYFVHSSFAGVNGSLYHSSEYAAKTDAQWIEMREEILKKFGEYKEETDKETAELNAL
jgi:hypothetical protein